MSSLFVPDCKQYSTWGWAYILPDIGESAQVQGALSEILPARDTCTPYIDALANGLPATDVWYFDGRPILAVASGGWQGLATDVTGWIDLGDKSHAVTLILA